jgi:NAD(P)-dependent dehydrogenase (short-subunit alcohol dehydrogenase family)
VGQEAFCRKAIQQTVKEFGKIDVLVNSAAEHHPQESIEKITEEQLEGTFRTNIFSFFFMTKAAMKHLKKELGPSIRRQSLLIKAALISMIILRSRAR